MHPILPVDIRLIDLPKSGGAMAPPAPAGTKALMSQVDHNDYLRRGRPVARGAQFLADQLTSPCTVVFVSCITYVYNKWKLSAGKTCRYPVPNLL